LFAFFNIPLNRKLAFVLASVMIAVIIGGSAVYASEGSLPGDLLYPIKTKVVEPIEIALAPTSEAKAEIETKFAERRLMEAETLDQVGKLTPVINKDLNKKFESHVANFYKIKNQIEKKFATSTERNSSYNSYNNESDANNIQKDFNEKIISHSDMVNKFNINFWGQYKIVTTSEKETEKVAFPIKINNDIKKIYSRNASSVENTKKVPFPSNFDNN
jgi:hypothetical protein